MKKIGISTLYTGYNYGSALQAFAVKTIVNNIGYDAEILHLPGSLVHGRDIRINKLATILLHTIFHPKEFIKTFIRYRSSINARFIPGTKELFEAFINEYLRPYDIKYKNLKNIANDSYHAFICGSDQIWDADTHYVDPFYYLRYAPYNMRIAFAPSFGKDKLADYNKEKIKEYITGIKYKSIREETGAEIIHMLTGERVQVLLDPTLTVEKVQWENISYDKLVDTNYLLVYFLNEPSKQVKSIIKKLAHRNKYKIIAIPYIFNDNNFVDITIPAGPREFISLVRHASFVCTDSFHGTAFSLKFNTPFYTFERNYGIAEDQSSRIVSLLKKTNTIQRYCKDKITSYSNINFEYVNIVLDSERKKSLQYIEGALFKIGCQD
ncbi:hypothetical protein SDC9_86822 [bioreactor metagenome]|uniref:Polysaccharide pyruvyl transferase domain-containing protein n=1 Tax=bioreactor metagenome TaxID=1076179 RepID=A0A644ZH02_9ZZZZ